MVTDMKNGTEDNLHQKCQIKIIRIRTGYQCVVTPVTVKT